MTDHSLQPTTSDLSLRIDAHQHFWNYDPVRDSWITEDMQVIRRNFLPGDLQPLLKENNMDGCVSVQADQSENETKFLLKLAEEKSFIKAVVGWVDLGAEDISERLQLLSHFKLLKGFRHILQGEKQRDFMLRPDFCNGIRALKKFEFTYDILVFPDQLRDTIEFVEKFPDQKFVIDHIAKPGIKNKEITGWQKEIQMIAAKQNVYCKISGLVTEADLKNWSDEDFHPYLDVVVEAFGTGRIMFGSDWPVCLLGGSYAEVVGIVKNYFSSFTKTEQDKFFGLNAIEFYNLK
jgi:L-fuconolactonase